MQAYQPIIAPPMSEHIPFGNHEQEPELEVQFEGSDSLAGILRRLLELSAANVTLESTNQTYEPEQVAEGIMELTDFVSSWQQRAELIGKPFTPSEWLSQNRLVRSLTRANGLRDAVVATLCTIANNRGEFYDAETAELYRQITGYEVTRTLTMVDTVKEELKDLKLLAAKHLTNIDSSEGRDKVRAELSRMASLLQTLDALYHLGSEMNVDMGMPAGRSALNERLSGLRGLLDEMD